MNSAANAALLALMLVLPLPVLAADPPEPPDSPFYAELTVSAYPGSGLTAQEAYLEFAVTDSVSLWANPYHEPGYASATAGIAKTVGGWTFAVGAGQNREGGERANILAPWVSYNSDDVDFVLTVERYDDGSSAYWQGWAQHRVGRHFLGVYGETGFGIGPMATFVINDHLRLRLALPVADRGEARGMVSLVITQ